MKPHHRTSLLLACIGIAVLYLPEGLRVVHSWPARPLLATPAAVASVPADEAEERSVEPPAEPAPLPRPTGPTYVGGQ